MHAENGLLVDLQQVEDIVATADVFALGFRTFPERLLIDTRHDDNDPEGPCALPMVAIVDPVETLQERFFWLGQHRPALGMPERFMFFMWPHSIRYLEESGVWEKIQRRIVGSGFYGAGETVEAALRDLTAREYRSTCQAIRGDGYQTLWSATEAV
jgi:hypothetical protein